MGSARVSYFAPVFPTPYRRFCQLLRFLFLPSTITCINPLHSTWSDSPLAQTCLGIRNSPSRPLMLPKPSPSFPSCLVCLRSTALASFYIALTGCTIEKYGIRNAWEYFGKGDELGTINWLTPAVIAAAATEIKGRPPHRLLGMSH